MTPEPILLIVSHPDDETLGCAHVLLRQTRHCHLLHTTNGAPAEARFWEQAGATTREEYAHSRRAELLAAMNVFGVESTQMQMLWYGDRDLPRNLTGLAEQVLDTIQRVAPGVIFTHPFEGGHPDHDSTCYATHRAIALLAREGKPVPVVREFTGYHARNGEFFSGAFLESDLPAGSTTGQEALTEAETEKKREALDCYQSQQRVIQRFALTPERWRLAIAPDFQKRPHSGPLYYELRGAGCTFEEFASLVLETDAALAL